MKLNEKIYYYRTKSKMSQEQLAAAVGVSRQAVSKWELGDATPEVAKLVSLAKVFGITTDDLLSEDEPEQDKAAADLGSEAAFQKTAPETGSVRQEDWLDRMPGFLGNLFRRYGWLAGVYVALSGLGFSIVGGIARFMFGQFFRVSMDAAGGHRADQGQPGCRLRVRASGRSERHGPDLHWVRQPDLGGRDHRHDRGYRPGTLALQSRPQRPESVRKLTQHHSFRQAARRSP